LPLTAEALRLALKPAFGGDDAQAFLASFVMLNFLIIFAGLWLLFRYCSLWFPEIYSLAAVLFSALSMLVGFNHHYYQPWSLLEPALFTGGLLALYHRCWLTLGLLIAVATLNRETSLVLALTYPVVWLFLPTDQQEQAPPAAQRFLRSLLYITIWALVYGGLRLVYGNVPHVHSLSFIWGRNLEQWPLSIVYLGLFFGLAWVYAMFGLGRLPFFPRRTAVLLLLYAAMFVVFQHWYEVRMLMTVYPLLLPALLAYFAPLKEERPA
ncbi:MAG TPA: hypothetical protein PK961_16960, partial [bacterium]|nr:hypothetical protein [bacterium]